ncbi:LppU/SCO3897 family protein, partial [Streptomyces griseoaurantiacus]|uniref:LppU/SCO3897 family protein n=1 Tax=Streptomyces griseoaurantiacus TaxID=68213 RepID=UPI00296F9D43
MSARVTRLAVLLGLVLVLSGVGAVLVLHFSAEGAQRLGVGDCVDLTGRGVVVLDCSATGSRYRVAKVIAAADASCPTGDYDWISQEHSRLADHTLCLMPNAREGDCFAGADGSRYAELSRI